MGPLPLSARSPAIPRLVLLQATRAAEPHHSRGARLPDGSQMGKKRKKPSADRTGTWSGSWGSHTVVTPSRRRPPRYPPAQVAPQEPAGEAGESEGLPAPADARNARDPRAAPATPPWRRPPSALVPADAEGQPAARASQPGEAAAEEPSASPDRDAPARGVPAGRDPLSSPDSDPGDDGGLLARWVLTAKGVQVQKRARTGVRWGLRGLSSSLPVPPKLREAHLELIEQQSVLNDQQYARLAMSGRWRVHRAALILENWPRISGAGAARARPPSRRR